MTSNCHIFNLNSTIINISSTCFRGYWDIWSFLLNTFIVHIHVLYSVVDSKITVFPHPQPYLSSVLSSCTVFLGLCIPNATQYLILIFIYFSPYFAWIAPGVSGFAYQMQPKSLDLFFLKEKDKIIILFVSPYLKIAMISLTCCKHLGVKHTI